MPISAPWRLRPGQYRCRPRVFASRRSEADDRALRHYQSIRHDLSDQERKRHRRVRPRLAIRTAPRLFPRNIEEVLKGQSIVHFRRWRAKMAIMKIGRAPFIAYSIVSCVLLAGVNVARADLGGDPSLSATPRTAPSEVVKARIILLEAVPCTYSARRQARTSTGRRNLCDARRNFRLRYVTELDTMRRGTNVKHVVRLNRAAPLPPPELSFASSRSARGRWGPAPDMSCGLSVARLGVLSFMWCDRLGGGAYSRPFASVSFGYRYDRPVTLLLPCVDDFVYFRSFRRVNDRPSNAAASRLILA